MSPLQEEPGAWVPGSEIYAELRRLSDLVVRLDERLNHDRTYEDLQEVEERVTHLEKTVWRSAGMATALGAIIGMVVPIITR